MGEVRSKLPKYITRTKERAGPGLVSGVFAPRDWVGRILCEFQTARSNNVTEVVNSLNNEAPLFLLERDTLLNEQPQYAQYLLDVVRRRLRKDDNDVQVDDGELSADRGEDDLHCPLKGFRGVVQP